MNRLSTKNFDLKTFIIDETLDYIAINKPAMLPTLGDRIQTDKNLFHFVKKYNDKALICHRLDKDTSGIIVFAKNKEAQRWLTMQFMRKEVFKKYICIVHGQHNFNMKPIKACIAKNSKNISYISKYKGKSAKTIFNTKEIYKGYTHIECFPTTGRTHQIRVHASKLNAPLIKDLKYGGRDVFLSQIKKNFNFKKNKIELPMIKRIPLHSSQIEFLDKNKNKIIAEAPVPKDYSILIKHLEKFSKIKNVYNGNIF